MRKPKWEKALPKSYIIAAMEENPTSLKLKVEIETTDTAETKYVHIVMLQCTIRYEPPNGHTVSHDMGSANSLSQ